MKSIRRQLLVTLAAMLLVGGILIVKGPPPDQDLPQAAWAGNIEQVRRALKWGEGVNEHDWGGVTALHFAAYAGNIEMADLLIRYGANLEASCALAQFCGTPLCCAVAAKREDLVELLLDAGADANAIYVNGQTVLFEAKTPGIAMLLLDHGARVNAHDQHGATPLHAAVSHSLPKVAILLVKRGADILARTDAGVTPLWIIAHNPFIKAEELKELQDFLVDRALMF